jgi:hypothetical protein
MVKSVSLARCVVSGQSVHHVLGIRHYAAGGGCACRNEDWRQQANSLHKCLPIWVNYIRAYNGERCLLALTALLLVNQAEGVRYSPLERITRVFSRRQYATLGRATDPELRKFAITVQRIDVSVYPAAI